MPDYQEAHDSITLSYHARRFFSKLLGQLPFPWSWCMTNDAKFGLDLGDLKYSQEVISYLAQSVKNREERAQLIVSYLSACNPNLEKSLSRMSLETKRSFFTRLSDDQQFNWCLQTYPDIELGYHHMQPGLNGLHVSDSVTRDNQNNKLSGSAIAFIIMYLLRVPGSKQPDDSTVNLFKKALPQDPSRPGAANARDLGLTGAFANFIAQTFFYRTLESHKKYLNQKSKEQAERTIRLLQQNVQKVVSEHTERVFLPRGHGGGQVECISILPENSPSVETSVALRRLKSGHTGCTSICGTQTDVAVKECLKGSHTSEYSHQENLLCEAVGPFKTEAALKNHYLGEAREGVYTHESQWRRDQKNDPLFNKQCKKPLEGNFNFYPESSVDKISEEGPYQKFASRGDNFNKGCSLAEFPNPNLPDEGITSDRITLDQIQDLRCEDNPGVDISQNSYNPNIEPISPEKLNSILQELRDSLSKLSKLSTERYPEVE